MIRQSLFFVGLLTVFGVSYAGGSGVGTPISSCLSLITTIPMDMTGSYYLTDNIDCQGTLVNPIRNAVDTDFSGILDGGIYAVDELTGELKYTGANYSISNFTIINNDFEIDNDVGLFRALSSKNGSTPTIKNIDFSTISVRGRDKTNRGTIAGKAEKADISNINISDLKIEARDDLDTRLDDTGVTGGVVGLAIGIKLSNVHVTDAVINKNGYGGGLIGRAALIADIKKSSVKITNTTGNQCWLNDPSLCGFGGLIGHIEDYSTVNISESSASGKITVYKRIGGLVGVVEPSGALTISNSYSTVDLVPDCSWQDGVLNTCIYAGGLVGRAKEDNNGIKVFLSNVYAAGKVKPDGDEKGRAIIGDEDQKGSMRVIGNNSYFDKNAVEKKNSGDKISIAKTTDEMQDADNAAFVTWDRNIWKFEDGKYPALYYNNPPAN